MQQSLNSFLGKKKRAEQQACAAYGQLPSSKRSDKKEISASKSSSRLLQALNTQYRRSQDLDAAQPGPGSAESWKTSIQESGAAKIASSERCQQAAGEISLAVRRSSGTAKTEGSYEKFKIDPPGLVSTCNSSLLATSVAPDPQSAPSATAYTESSGVVNGTGGTAHSSATAEACLPCPLCGQAVPASHLQDHIQQELELLDEAGAIADLHDNMLLEEGDAYPASLPPSTTAAAAPSSTLGACRPTACTLTAAAGPPGGHQPCHRPQHLPASSAPPPPRLAGSGSARATPPVATGPGAAAKRPKVLVLGGRPQATAPTDPILLEWRRSTRARQQQYQQQQAAHSSFNHYADGCGALGGDDIGIDGAEHAGLNWEGMGTCTL